MLPVLRSPLLAKFFFFTMVCAWLGVPLRLIPPFVLLAPFLATW
jgi:hypothetical protein